MLSTIIALADPIGSGMVDASSMLGHFMQSFPGLVKLVNVAANVAGITIAYVGVMKFRHVLPRGEVRVITPIMWLFVGTALINLAASVQTGLATLFGSGASVHNLLAYSSPSGMPEASKELITTIIACARLFGLVAAIRGIMVLRHAGDPNFQRENVIKSGLMRFTFGCLLLNVVETMNVLAHTFGWGQALS